MAGKASAINSVVSGTGVSGNLIAFNTYTVTVTAKDASGNYVGTGGDIFTIEIYNYWTLDSNLNWNEVFGAKQTLSAPIKATMTDNGDGTYSYNYSVLLDGAVTVIVKLNDGGIVNWKWYNNVDYTEPPTTTSILTQLDFNYLDIFPGYLNEFTGKLSGTIKPPTTESYTFRLISDDWSKMTFNGVVTINNLPWQGLCDNTFTVSLDQNTYYDFEVDYYQGPGGYWLHFYYSTATAAETSVPSSFFSKSYVVASSPYQLTASCPAGYNGNQASSPTQCITVWGDGIKAGSEQWDDENTINDDGCQSDWTLITPGFAWTGGGLDSKDVWTQCLTGYTPNSDKTAWVAIWGDGLKMSTESWDDGNTSNSDGWSSVCLIESGYSCTGGSTTSKDTWVAWSSGYYQDTTNPSTWITHCGDGLRVGSEGWDDLNTSNSDGCASTCTIESGYIWNGGSAASRDTWTIWTSGYSPNSAKTLCIAICGDGYRVGSEAWDDSNVSSADGCSNAWTIESGYSCTGGSITSKDTWVAWSAGLYQDPLNPSSWIAHCGDGLRANSEEWDDSNSSNGDGCTSSWAIESGYACSGGTTSSKDTWTLWTSGFYPNGAKSQWVSTCGDSLRVGSEKCDDGNTSSGDGCKNDWSSVESGYVCSGGSSTSKDTWTLWAVGFYQNDATNPTLCVTHWGDSIKAGTEQCDDGNNIDNDGWKADCTLITSGYVWSGGSSTSKDVWVQWTTGFTVDSTKSNWIPIWGDGLRVGSEKWDDGNTSSGDGCKNDWLGVESGYVWSGGTSTSKDIWTKWGVGYYQNDSTNPTKWVTLCGDGIAMGNEEWDDGNSISGDGWSSDCLTIESGYVWFGHSFGITDVWLQCDLGYDPNPDYSTWVGATVPRDTKAIAAATQAAAVSGVTANLILTAFTSSSSSSSTSSNSFGMLNQIQLVIILPLVGAYIPEKIYDYLKSMNTNLFNLNFLPTSSSSSTVSFKKLFDFRQPNQYLHLLSLNSGSAFVNIIDLMTTVLIIVAIEILLLIIYVILKITNKFAKIKSILWKILEMLTFGFYIGVCWETFILFLIVDISEIYYQNKTQIVNKSSTVMSYVIATIILSFIALTFWQWWKSRKPEVFKTQKYFVTLVKGFKPSWIWRSYWLMFLIRRTLFILVIFILQEYEMMLRISIFASIQGVYFGYIIFLRPHDSIKENLNDFINEVFYLFYTAFLLHFNIQERWTDTITDAYFWILMSNNFILIFIMLGKKLWLDYI